MLKLTLSVFPCQDFLSSAAYGCCHPCLSSIITCLLFSFASENFQVMNYGIGGQISLHGDNPGLPSLENSLIGGKIVFVFFLLGGGAMELYPQTRLLHPKW